MCLEYEGLHSICFRCGKYGHKQDSCREFLGESQINPSKHVSTMMDTDSSNAAKPSEATVNNIVQEEPDVPVSVDDEFKAQEKRDMGPWNIPRYIAKKKKKPPSHVTIPKEKTSKDNKRNVNQNSKKVPTDKPGDEGPSSMHADVNAAVHVSDAPSDPVIKVNSVNVVEIPIIKVRNANGGRNPQNHVKAKNSQIPNVVGSSSRDKNKIKEGKTPITHATTETGKEKNKVHPLIIKILCKILAGSLMKKR